MVTTLCCATSLQKHCILANDGWNKAVENKLTRRKRERERERERDSEREHAKQCNPSVAPNRLALNFFIKDQSTFSLSGYLFSFITH